MDGLEKSLEYLKCMWHIYIWQQTSKYRMLTPLRYNCLWFSGVDYVTSIYLALTVLKMSLVAISKCSLLPRGKPLFQPIKRSSAIVFCLMWFSVNLLFKKRGARQYCVSKEDTVLYNGANKQELTQDTTFIQTIVWISNTIKQRARLKYVAGY